MPIHIVDFNSLTQSFFSLTASELARVESISISGVDLNQPLHKIQDLDDVQQQMYVTDGDDCVFTIELHQRDVLDDQSLCLESLFHLFSYTLMKCPSLTELSLNGCHLGSLPGSLEMLANDLSQYCPKLVSLAIQNDDFSYPQAGIIHVEEYFSQLPIRHLNLSQTRLFRAEDIDDDEDLQDFCEHSRTLVLALLSPEHLTKLSIHTQEVADTVTVLTSKKIRRFTGSMAPQANMDSLEYSDEAWQCLDLATQVAWLIQKLHRMQRDFGVEDLQALRLKLRQELGTPLPTIDQRLLAFASLSNPTRKPTPQVAGRDADGVEHVFDIKRITGDGHCGFTALEISRHDMANFLRAHVGQADVIARFKSVLLEYLILQKHPLHIAVLEQEEALRELLADLPNDIFEAIKDTPTRLQWLREHDQVIIADVAEAVWYAQRAAELELNTYLGSDDLFIHYCDELRHQLWLDTESIRLYAEAHGFSVYIWQPQASNSAIYLNPAHSYFAQEATQTIHLLYDGQHFDRLFPSNTPFLANDLRRLPSPLSEDWVIDMGLFNTFQA